MNRPDAVCLNLAAALAGGEKVLLQHGRKTRLMLLDDHPVVTLGAAALLSAQADMLVLAAVQTVVALRAALQAQPGACDVLVLDLHLPQEPLDGIGLLKRLRREYPGLCIVVYSALSAAHSARVARQAGANGYLCKRTPPSVLVEIVRAVRLHRLQFQVFEAGAVCSYLPGEGFRRLSASESEVLRHLADGLGVVQVAHKLHRSKQTISSHKRSAMRKLLLEDDLALALYLQEYFPR